jgi:hypothetical protein
MKSATGHLMGASYESWTLGLAIASFLIVIIGTFAAVRQLTALARQSNFAGAVEFQKLTRDNETRVVKLLQSFPVVVDADEIDNLAPDVVSQAKLVINSLNDNGQLLEAGLITKRLYFGLYHTQIVRLVFLLRPLMEWEEKRSGGRYGRRLLRLDKRARRYHDMRAIHRSTVISLTRDDRQYHIHQSTIETGWQGRRQRLVWFLRWTFNRF